MIPSGTVVNAWCAFVDKTLLTGKATLSPTFDLINAQTRAVLVDGQAYTGAGPKNGLYYYSYTAPSDIYGGIIVIGHTDDSSVQAKDVFGWIDDDFSLTATKIGYLDASINSRSSHSAADVWSVVPRTLTSGGSVTAKELWDYLLSEATTTGSVGKWVKDKLAYISSANVRVAPGPVLGDTILIRKGCDYNDLDSRRIEVPVSGAPDLTNYDLSFDFGVDGDFVGVASDADIAGLDLTATQTSGLTVGLRRYAIWATSQDTDTRTFQVVEGPLDIRESTIE